MAKEGFPRENHRDICIVLCIGARHRTLITGVANLFVTAPPGLILRNDREVDLAQSQLLECEGVQQHRERGSYSLALRRADSHHNRKLGPHRRPVPDPPKVGISHQLAIAIEEELSTARCGHLLIERADIGSRHRGIVGHHRAVVLVVVPGTEAGRALRQLRNRWLARTENRSIFVPSYAESLAAHEAAV